MNNAIAQFHHSFVQAIRCKQIFAVGEILGATHQLTEPVYLDHQVWLQITGVALNPVLHTAVDRLAWQVDHILAYLKRQMEQEPDRKTWLVPLDLSHHSDQNYFLEPTSVIVQRHTYAEGITVLLAYIPDSTEI